MGLCRYLGNTSVKLPALGQGTTQTGSYAISTDEGDRQRIGVLRLGIELGMSLIDTAELYGGGHSEEVVGTAIKGIRDNVFLASKFRPENSTAEGLMRAIEGSLRRLQTDYLDLYQWHWPNPQVPLEETLDALLTLKSQGKIRFIGVSNFTVKELETARSHGGPSEIASTQVEYNLSQRAVERDVLPYCQREHVTLLAYSPLGGGSTLVDGRRSRLLRDIGEKYEKSAAQIALRWLLTRASVIPIVKSSDPKHTLENAQAAKFELDREDIERIDREFRQRIMHIMPFRIRVQHKEGTAHFRSVHEAIRNKRDLVPAPSTVASNIQRGNVVKPIRLVPLAERSGLYDYALADSEILYWAWVIAKGMDEPMPAFVHGNS